MAITVVITIITKIIIILSPVPKKQKRKHCSKPQSSTSFINFNVFTCAFLCESHTLFLFTPNDSFLQDRAS